MLKGKERLALRGCQSFRRCCIGVDGVVGRVVAAQFLTLTPLLFFFFLLFCHYPQAFIAGADEVMRGLAPVRVHNQMLASGEQRGEHLRTGKGGESAAEVHCCVSIITALILPVFYSGNLNTATPFRVTLLNTQTKIAPKKSIFFFPPCTFSLTPLSNLHTDRAGDVFPERRRPYFLG